jgi:FlaA1/EpsC-like NDP-sugar epimerase
VTVPTRILLVGAGYTGGIVAAEYRRRGLADTLVGFLDDDPRLRGTAVADLPVLGDVASLADVVRARQIDEVVITIPSAPGTRLREITDACTDAGVVCRTMPGILELLGQPITARQLRRVEVADLLRRAEVGCDAPPQAYLTGRRVLVTGAGGSIGRELCRQILLAEPEALVLLGRGENAIHACLSDLQAEATPTRLLPVIVDVRNRAALQRVVVQEAPDVVFHAAAHKHVPLMEAQPAEAVANNVLGTRNMVDVAAAHGVQRLVFISTDKAVSPTSVMGATKRLGEWLVTDAARRVGLVCLSVRFGNVLGSRGSVVPVLERQIRRGGPITLTHPDMRRFFMTIPEAVHLVLLAGGRGRAGDLFVLDMGEPMSIVDLAHDVIRLSGASDAIRIEYGGLRPGEKMVESLWEEGSRLTPVEESRLFLVEEPADTLPRGTVADVVASLDAAASHDDPAEVHRVLSRVLPTFRSSRA